MLSPFVNFSLTFAFRSPPPPALPLRPPPWPPPRASGSRARAPDGGGGGSARRGPAPSGSARPGRPEPPRRARPPRSARAEQPPGRAADMGARSLRRAGLAPTRTPGPDARAPRPGPAGAARPSAGDLLLASLRALALDRMVSARGISLLLPEPRSSYTLSSSPQHCQFGHLHTLPPTPFLLFLPSPTIFLSSLVFLSFPPS